jgi:hypothetical protein
MTNVTEGTARMRGQMEALEWAYGEITHRDLVASRPDENGAGVYRFDDGAESPTLPAAIDYGQTLVRFALNQLNQSAG